MRGVARLGDAHDQQLLAQVRADAVGVLVEVRDVHDDVDGVALVREVVDRKARAGRSSGWWSQRCL